VKALRVGLDAHMVGGQETGNETYIKGLVEGFSSNSSGLDLVVYNVGAPWTSSHPHLRFRRLLTGNPYVRLGIELPIRSLAGIDLLHMTYGAPVWSAAPIILTVHDICYATNPEWFSARDLRVLSSVVPRSIFKAAHVITDSQSARNQIIEVYRVPESKISAIPIGPGSGAEAITAEEARAEVTAIGLSPDRPYILTVGNVQPRKNLIRLIEAFRELVSVRGHDVDLVIVGPRRFRSEDIVESSEGVSDHVRFTGYITDRQLAACYRGSTAFVLPSLYEGFGLPALEALAHGVPTACSNAGALPEVCGTAAIMFDPYSIEAIVEALDRILTDTSLREQLSAEGPKRAAEFSWARTAKLTLGAYAKARA
jgi:glycosyltransferase involved in cell wall biosynthesis